MSKPLFIRSKLAMDTDSGLVITIKNNNLSKGAHIVVEPRDDVNHGFQKWFQREEGNGCVTFVAESTPNLAMTLSGKPGPDVQVVNDTLESPPGQLQLWKTVPQSGGLVTIVPNCGGHQDFSLTLKGGSATKGSSVVVTNSIEGMGPPDTQLWQLCA